MAHASEISTQCCVVGGGPAGMMLGLLLARAGVRVVLLEKHADFLRDFRGDTIHPSTMEIMHELGMLDEFLRLPHQKVSLLSGKFGDQSIPFADLSHLRVQCPFIAFMPQWDFLEFLSTKARHFLNFSLMMHTEATSLVEDHGRVAGIEANSTDGPVVIRSDLVVGADGRHSIIRARAALLSRELGAPIDVLWFRLPRLVSDSAETVGRFAAGGIFIMINRGDYWQCGFVIAKGSLELLRGQGLESFRTRVARLEPSVADRVTELRDWNDVSLLTVQVDRLTQWYRPGLLCIGDAAHAMSPVGGVGINLAIQDAVAAANVLAGPLRAGRLTVAHLRQVERRRLLPVWLIQAGQVAIQKRVLQNVLSATGMVRPPLALRLTGRFPLLRRIPGRLLGLGIRAEHVESAMIA